MNLLKIARRSPCRYKVAAFGFDARGKCIGYAYNLPRLSKLGGGVHAEIALLKKVGTHRIKSMLVVRSSKGGLNEAKIHVCPSCSKVINKLGIRILSSHP